MLSGIVGRAQVVDSLIVIENFKKEMEEDGYRNDENSNPGDLIEVMDYMVRNKIKVNEASLDELSVIPVISRDQAIRLSVYIASYGAILSRWELMAIDGFDSLTIALIIPYLDFSPAGKQQRLLSRIWYKPKSRIIMRWQHPLTKQAGYSPESDSLENRFAGVYPGSADRLLFKYTFETKGGFRAGITAEKDPGEEFFNKNQPGFDFYSAYAFLKNTGIVKQLVLGDFHANFGQGLTLWTGFGFRKPTDPLWLNRNGQGLRPSTGTDENRFLRGAGTMVALGNWRFTAFVSSLKVDGTEDNSDTIEMEYHPAISPSGLHRTSKELAAKDAVNQTVFGGRLGWQNGMMQIGITGYIMKYNSPVQQSDAFYQKYCFSGTESKNCNLDYQVIFRRLAFFGELGMNRIGAIGLIAGVRWTPDIRINCALLYRNYGVRFTSPLGAAFGENSRNSNEKGLYVAMSYIPLHKLVISGYADMYRFPWLNYRVDKSSSGAEYGLKAEYELSSDACLTFRYRYEHKEINLALNTGEISHVLSDRYRHSLRGSVKVKVTGTLRLTSLAEWSMVDLHGTCINGYMIGQQIRTEIGRWHFSGAFLLFSVTDWDTRMYLYEPDVLYAFSTPVVYGEGSRLVLLVNYDPLDWISLWLRYSISRFDEKTVLLKGPDDYLSADRQEMKVQMIIKIR